MTYSEDLAARIRPLLAGRTDIVERPMFGGLAFMVRGNMACGIIGDELMVRLGNEGVTRALGEDHTRPMDLTRRTIRSMIYVSSRGVADGDNLERWVAIAVDLALTLPPK